MIELEQIRHLSQEEQAEMFVQYYPLADRIGREFHRKYSNFRNCCLDQEAISILSDVLLNWGTVGVGPNKGQGKGICGGYNPSRGTPRAFIVYQIKLRLLNIIRAEKKRRDRATGQAVLEITPAPEKQPSRLKSVLREIRGDAKIILSTILSTPMEVTEIAEDACQRLDQRSLKRIKDAARDKLLASGWNDARIQWAWREVAAAL